MCTVTYIPAREGFTLTHNRDEAASRSLSSIERQRTENGDTLLFPRDASAGGTWFVSSSAGKTACLLNGAFELHKRQLPYRRSRGLMMLDFFDYSNPDDFFEQYDFEGIEPFTFLFFEPGKVVEFRWDGTRKYYKTLPADKAHFWCSATLYPAEMQAKRAAVFYNWLAAQATGKAANPEGILYLHLKGSVGDPAYDFVMNRDGRVQTVSITQVLFRKKIARMRFFDLLEGNRDERLVSLTKR